MGDVTWGPSRQVGGGTEKPRAPGSSPPRGRGPAVTPGIDWRRVVRYPAGRPAAVRQLSPQPQSSAGRRARGKPPAPPRAPPPRPPLPRVGPPPPTHTPHTAARPVPPLNPRPWH